MRITDIIIKKRNKLELSKQEIDFFVDGTISGNIPDYQISALLMAIVLNGMTDKETVNLTVAMANSGDVLDLSSLGKNTVDKHSTGGVGDKTTLIVAPVAAALGCVVAKMSGRGLGYTGGTVDKLQSICGYRTDITEEEFFRNAKENGMCIMGHSANLAAADKKLYAIRDVTGTVDSIPLIAASIMSKKIAAGAKNIVLDVKYGSGAFMKNQEEAEQLASTMVNIGKLAGRNTMALITNMDCPLGYAIGNSIEVEEAVSVLKGNGPADLTEISIELAAAMYRLCFEKSYDESITAVKHVIENGKAFNKLCAAVEIQGGDSSLIRGEHQFKKAAARISIKSECDGYIYHIDSQIVGRASCISGAGRELTTDTIDPSAGIILKKKTGDKVRKGDLLAIIMGQEERILEAKQLIETAYTITDTKPILNSLLYKIIL